MKVCNSCGLTKEFLHFHSRGDGPGYRSICILCWRLKTNARPSQRKIPKLSIQEKAINTKAAQKRFTTSLKGRSAHAAAQAKRRATKLQATPKWLTEHDHEGIKWHYVVATSLTVEWGVKMTVDHIIPLKGKNVSGLHVPWNLCVMTSYTNTTKNNRTDKAMYEALGL